MAETKTTTGVSLDPTLIEDLDSLSLDERRPEFFGRSRSSIIESILRKFLNTNGKKKSRR